MPDRSPLRAGLPLALALMLASVRPVAAQYTITSWTTAEGLPQSSVIAIAQTPDGFIWVTTLGGLARFDGSSFRTFDTTTNPELPHSRFAGAIADDAGHLWLTLQTGELLRYADGRFHRMGAAEGLPAPPVTRLNLHRGRLVVESRNGALVWQDGRFVRDPAFELPAEHAALTFAGIAEGYRARWYRDAEGRAYRFENGRLTRTVELPGRLAYEDRSGRVWALLPGTGELVCLDGGRIRTYGRRDGQLGMEHFALKADPDGTLWFMSSFGLMRFRDGRFTSYTTADGLLDNQIRNVFRDREGSHWVGTNTGLARLVEKPIVSFTAADGLDADNTYPILQDRRGAIWIGAWSGLTRYRDGVFERVSASYQVQNRPVTSLMEDRDGAIWIGTLGDGVRKIAGGRVERVDGPLFTAHVLLQGKGSDIWIGTENGLLRYRDKVFSRVARANGTTGAETSALYEDSTGTIWVGNLDGLARVVDGLLVQVGEGEGFSGKRVRAIHEDSSGALWVGTYDTGLFRYRDGRFTRFTYRDGLPSNGAFRIIEDDQGRFWISSNVGIYRVARADLDAVAERRSGTVTAVLYGRDDGMANQECNGLGQPAGIRANDGRLWFPTQRGVAIVDPASLTLNTAPPPVTFLDVSVGGYSTAERDRIEIRSGSREFQVRYAALTFVRPELARFKYRMEGVDADWVDAGTDRTARYADLPFGTFRFRVIAANRDGVWTESGASLRIVVVPPFYRTTWFAALTIAFIGATAFGAHRWRLSAIERRQAVQQAFARQLIDSQEADRKRIAADLHDGVSQTLVVIRNWAAGIQTADDAAQRRLGQIASAASQALGEVREVVHELLPYHLEQLGLQRAIREAAARVSDASGISVTCALLDVDNALAPDMALRLFRIVQEALNNVVKHSAATRVALDARVESGTVRLTVRDDGRGFNPETVVPTTSGHGFGLVGISERARMMGGSVTLESAPGQGTSLVVEIPCAPRSTPISQEAEESPACLQGRRSRNIPTG